MPNSEPMQIAIIATETVKLREAKVRRSSSARSAFCSLSCRQTKTAMAPTPTATGAQPGMAPAWPAASPRLESP